MHGGENMKYIPIQCKSVIRNVKDKMTPYNYDANIYRGCAHGCIYCYALYSHDYLNDKKFYDHIYYKENFCEVLEKEISSPRWKKEMINFGSISDSYQPAEKELKIMRDVLKLMIKYKNPISIATKSKLILRDLDLIEELSLIAEVQISCTITCADERIQKILEPHASSSLERMKTLQIIKQKTHASTHILLMPVVPYMNDSYANLEAIYKLASQIGVEDIYCGALYLRGKTKPYFLNHIKAYDEDIYKKISSIYYHKDLKKAYKQQLYQKVDQLKKQYNL
jgi:DNA repair photolyase